MVPVTIPIALPLPQASDSGGNRGQDDHGHGLHRRIGIGLHLLVQLGVQLGGAKHAVPDSRHDFLPLGSR